MARRGRTGAPAAAAVRPAARDEPASRITQVVAGVVLGVVSALLMVTTHRAGVDLLGVRVPTGLLLGAAFQVACCVFLLASMARLLPLLVLAATWCLAAAPFTGRSAGGGVVMPGSLGGHVQYQGWAVQILGVGIPLVVVAACWFRRFRGIQRAAAGPRAV